MPGCVTSALRRAVAPGARLGLRGSRLATSLVLAGTLVQAPEDAPRIGSAPDRGGRLDADGHLHSDHREFHFTRAVYTGLRRRNWAIDYPKADRQLMVGVQRLLTHLDACAEVNPVRLDDPDLGRYPFVYAVEVGHMAMTEAEVRGLRRYLEAGGFLMVDDFWGTWEWDNFESEIHRVLPGCRIVDLPRDHPLYRAFYDITEFPQVPNVGNAQWGRTWEQDGYTPFYRGINDDKGRLMVAINHNTDLGDAWEWAEVPEYPLKYSTFAYQMAVNAIIYSMSH
jgi:hypothetical protein